MKRLSAFILLFLVLVLMACKTQPEETAIAIVGGLLIDGNGGEPLTDQVVVIRGERIAAVGPRRSVSIPGNAIRIDANGKTVLPGLINSNVHFGLGVLCDWSASPRTADTSCWKRNYTKAQENVLRYAKTVLLQGITSVRNTSGPLEALLAARSAIENGEAVGTRIFVGGPILSSAHEYDAVNPEMTEVYAKALSRRIENISEDLKPIQGHEINFWKIGLTGGDFGSTNVIDDDLLKAIVSAGHKHGKVIDAHIMSIAGIRSGLAAGLDAMMHPNLSEPLPMALVQEMARKGVIVAPLHIALEGYVEIFDNPDLLSDPIYQNLLPADEYNELQQIKERLLRARRTPEKRPLDVPTPVASRHSLNEWHSIILFCRDNLRKFIQAKVRIAMATDIYTPFNFPETAWHVRELATYVQFGMTPLQALQTATRNAAELLKMEKELGTIEPGKLGDIVIVNGNPLNDINVLRNVEVVIKNGRRYK